MRLFEDLISNSNKLKYALIVLVIIDFLSIATKDTLDISYSITKSPHFKSQLNITIIKSVLELALAVITIILILRRKIMSLIFITIIYTLVLLVLGILDILNIFSYFATPSRPLEYYDKNIETINEILLIFNYMFKVSVLIIMFFFIKLQKTIQEREKEEFDLMNNEEIALKTNTAETLNSTKKTLLDDSQAINKKGVQDYYSHLENYHVTNNFYYQNIQYQKDSYDEYNKDERYGRYEDADSEEQNIKMQKNKQRAAKTVLGGENWKRKTDELFESIDYTGPEISEKQLGNNDTYTDDNIYQPDILSEKKFETPIMKPVDYHDKEDKTKIQKIKL